MNLIEEARALHALHEHIHGCGLHHLAPKAQRPDMKALQDGARAETEIRRVLAEAEALLAVVPDGHLHPYLDGYRQRVAALKRELPAIVAAIEVAAASRAAAVDREAAALRAKSAAENAVLDDARRRELAAEAEAKRSAKRGTP